MPELPEVETIRRGLVDRLIGDEITEVTINVPRMFRGDPNQILHTKITNIRRIAKVLVIDFANANSLLIHFKMTGQLVYVKNKDIAVGGHPEKVYENPLPHKHTHIMYHLSDKGILYYNDLRKFGWHRVVKTAVVADAIGKELAGIDVLSPGFSLKNFEAILKLRPKRPIKEAIMEQQHIAGIGNIYAAEALWQAKVRPDRTTQSLNKNEIKALYEGIKFVIDLSLKYGGSSFNSYIDAAGKQGAYLKFAEVYKKEKDSLGHEIQRIKQGGRTTHFCPICQK